MPLFRTTFFWVGGGGAASLWNGLSIHFSLLKSWGSRLTVTCLVHLSLGRWLHNESVLRSRDWLMGQLRWCARRVWGHAQVWKYYMTGEQKMWRPWLTGWRARYLYNYRSVSRFLPTNKTEGKVTNQWGVCRPHTHPLNSICVNILQLNNYISWSIWAADEFFGANKHVK